MWLTPPSAGQPFRSRQICAASLGSTERSGATCGVVIGRIELAIACRLATCVDFCEVARQTGLELGGSLEVFDLAHPASQWVPSGTNLGHQPSLALRASFGSAGQRAFRQPKAAAP
jgi:hypothetical protein